MSTILGNRRAEEVISIIKDWGYFLTDHKGNQKMVISIWDLGDHLNNCYKADLFLPQNRNLTCKFALKWWQSQQLHTGIRHACRSSKELTLEKQRVYQQFVILKF